uniref:Uncharacterized protein n=1 Tax=Arundo donax TaxID=35708 RepID=A0A0A9DMT6_ARUDO
MTVLEYSTGHCGLFTFRIGALDIAPSPRRPPEQRTPLALDSCGTALHFTPPDGYRGDTAARLDRSHGLGSTG